MENFYKCEVNNGDTRHSVIISTNETFLQQYNKNKKEKFEELKENAYDKVIANAISIGVSIDRDNLILVYYKEMTKEEVDLEMEEAKFEEEWYEELLNEFE
ncbi:hypothetical protein FHP05_00150 [Cerasibacillus terrae]|uniref:Uncharacterized protein n=1 Tax=Cerasibacillus terrae TaxID=2498845 RepID=A0A5C8P1I8_9BACI|nr:hypothetical protein [Cerasibacillus terrae]TXL67469.1 hypothetical protein FHP05_00150 [Cerasibacillus terrae]